MMSRRFTFKQTLILITFTILLFALVLNLSTVWDSIGKFLSYFAPLTMGLAMAYIMNIMLRMWENRVFARMKRSPKQIVQRMVRPLSIVLTVVIILAIIAVLIAVVLPELKDSLLTLVNKLPKYFEDGKAWVIDTLSGLNIDTEWIADFTVDWKRITNLVTSLLDSDAGSSLVGGAQSIATSVTGGLVNIVFSLVIAIYFLAQKERICAFVSRIVRTFLPTRIAECVFHITNLSNDVFSNFIRGQCTEAVILGMLSYIGMLIFRFEYATVISIMIGVTALVPIVGALVGEIFGVFLLLTVSPVRALIFLVFILVLQQLEGSLIYPRVVGTSVGLPGIIVFSAVLIGGNMFGILGALLAVPVCAVLYTLLREEMDRRAKLKEAKEAGVEATE